VTSGGCAFSLFKEELIDILADQKEYLDGLLVTRTLNTKLRQVSPKLCATLANVSAQHALQSATTSCLAVQGFKLSTISKDTVYSSRGFPVAATKIWKSTA